MDGPKAIKGLKAPDLLRLLEAGHGRNQLDRGLLLLEHASPRDDYGSLFSISLAERDRRLVALRRATFGSTIEVTTRCPECETALETPMDLRLLAELPAPDHPMAVHEHGDLRFRLPSTFDLMTALRSSEDPRRALVRRSLRTPDPKELDDEHLDRLVPELAAAWEAVDPMAEVRLDFRCIACEATFHRVFDIAETLYTEVEAHGRRLLLDIHALASAYGWTEDEVLALGPVRRRLYVDMVSG